MSETMVVYDSKTNATISVDPNNLIQMAINVIPSTSINLVAGTTLAESSIAGLTAKVYRPATSAETRTGILMNDVTKVDSLSTPVVESELKAGVQAVHGVFKTANITDETVKGTLQSETLANTNLFFV